MQEHFIDPVRTYNRLITVDGKATVRNIFVPVSYTHLDVYKRQGKAYYDALKSVHDLVKGARKVQQTILLVAYKT